MRVLWEQGSWRGGNIWDEEPRFHNSNNSEETTFFSQRSEKDKRINVDNHKCWGIKTMDELVQLGYHQVGFGALYAPVIGYCNVGPGKQKELRMLILGSRGKWRDE